MKLDIYPSRYKDQPAVTLESGALCAQFLPGTGAKLASLVYKPLRYELLVQRPGEQYLLQPYDGNYVAGECSGFDDMFPTIDECCYPSYPWKGTPMPDHGEVWSLPWEHTLDQGCLRMSTCGVRFPYRLKKTISFLSDEILHLEYRLENLSSFDFDFMWAAHTMFYLEEGAELLLPPGVGSVMATMSFSGALGRYGDQFPWPAFELPDGTRRDLSKLRPRSARDAEKYFVRGKMPAGWCGLTFPRSDFSLFLSFPVEQVPYLGILPNEGGWQDLYNIFLEPGTASLDRLDVARLHNEYSTVKARSTVRWHLNITLAAGAGRRRVNESGEVQTE